jgi:hypothetical protein
MSNLVQSRFFSLLSEPSQATNEEIQSAYEDFIKQVTTISSSDDYANTFRTLNITRIEVSSLETAFRYEQGKQIGSLQQTQKKDNVKLLKLISLYSDLASCGVMDGKRKENLKAEIMNLINEP